ncbi:hypothetical protein CISIN_1g047884mg [Citrus sinensis]|uniref:Uncharacterized protein n=1 Tax=Citrus sinensis TaxID=2711 RepID=A0A067GPY6_CITSI|nr:hypothetical protein CISIN_1g047884mg [Citrus sinensis]
MKSFFFKFALVAALLAFAGQQFGAEARYGVGIHCTKDADCSQPHCKCDLALSMCNCFVPPVGSIAEAVNIGQKQMENHNHHA